MPLIIANWKENLTVREAADWLGIFDKEAPRVLNDNVKVVICPQYTHLPVLHDILKTKKYKFEVVLGSQDVSKFEEGAYTGEVSVKTLSAFAEYAIVGHSERRMNFNESDEDVRKKLGLCINYGIVPVLCVSNLNQLKILEGEYVDKRNAVVTWETPEHISGGGKYRPEDPVTVNGICKEVKASLGDGSVVLYGGSVNRGNLKDFIAQNYIDGVLIGQASLDPLGFADMLKSL